MEEGFKSYTILIAVSLVSILFTCIFLKKRTKARLPPGPPALPVIGHLHLLRPPPHRSFHRLATRYGPLIHLRLGSTPCVVVSSPDVARDLLRTHDLAVSDRPSSTAARRFAYGSDGFAFAPYGPYWRFMKKLSMSDLLGGRTIDQLLPVRRQELLALLRTLWKRSRSGDEVDVTWELLRMTNNVITRMVASTSSSGEGGDTEEARKLVKEVAELMGTFNLADHIRFCRDLDLQGLGKRIEDVRRRFDALMERIIREREEVRKRREDDGDGGGSSTKDLLDILLDVSGDGKAEVKLTRGDIKAFILDIFTAGTDSSAATVDWALAELINNPTTLKKAREEIDAAVGKGRLVEETDIPTLSYLQAIVKETLRLHPAAPLAVRKTTEDIKTGDYEIPMNTTLFVNVWSLGRDPKYWEDPLEFRPERFLPSEKDGQGVIDVRGQHFQCLPFGSGMRICPGISLALRVVLVTLAAMVQCFDWKVGDGGGGKQATVDMTEGVGLVIARAKPIVCVPIARLEPFPDLEV